MEIALESFEVWDLYFVVAWWNFKKQPVTKYKKYQTRLKQILKIYVMVWAWRSEYSFDKFI